MRLFAWIFGLAVATTGLSFLTTPVADSYYERADKARSTCEVLFVGPSYIAAQVKPEIVDAEARRLGHPIKSCIFGRTSLKGYEQYRDIDRILGEPWPHLRLVFIDITLGGDTGYDTANRFNRRITRFHTWPLFAWYFKYFDSQRPQQHGHAWWFKDHVLHFLANTFLVGQGAEHLSARAEGLEPQREEKKKGKSKKKSKELAQKQKRQKPQDAAYEKMRIKRLRRHKKTHKTKVPTDELHELLRDEVELVARHGFRAEGLNAPSWAATDLAERLEGTDLVLHDFADPDRYPQLYGSGKHKRDGHLTNPGKKLYSQLLGRLAVERLEATK